MAVTVTDFYQEACQKDPMALVAGKRGLSKHIAEPAINRPGLALAGFFRHFAFRRIQVLGMAESEYLATLKDGQRRSVLRTLFQSHIPCLVVTRNRKVLPEIIDLADELDVPIMRSRLITGVFINMATMVMEKLMAPRIVVQGTMMDIMGVGVLIEGEPGIGKSEAALSLIERGHAIVADDVTVLRRVNDWTIIGSSAPVTRYHIEIHGLGIIHVPSLFGVASVKDEEALDMIVTLRKADKIQDCELGVTSQSRNVMGVDVPVVTIPVAPGRGLADVIEVATLNRKLKRLGHDAAKELDQKLISAMSKRTKQHER